jgi:hypothetical protein
MPNYAKYLNQLEDFVLTYIFVNLYYMYICICIFILMIYKFKFD